MSEIHSIQVHQPFLVINGRAASDDHHPPIKDTKFIGAIVKCLADRLMDERRLSLLLSFGVNNVLHVVMAAISSNLCRT